MKKSIQLLFFILTIFIIQSCSDSDSIIAPIDPLPSPPQLIEGLEQIEGFGISLLQENVFDKRGNLIFYKPVGINESKNYLPKYLTDNYFQLNNNVFPFDVENSDVIITTSNDEETNERRHQLQFHFYPKLDQDQDEAHWQAFSIFMSENDNPYYYDRDDKDYIQHGHQVRKRCFGESSVLVHTVLNPDEFIQPMIVFPYYNKNVNQIYGMGRVVTNRISIHHNGIYYVIGFGKTCQLTPEEAEEIALKFVGAI